MTSIQYSNFKNDAGAILINRKTRAVALIKMHHNVWGFPKGGFRDDESILNGAMRQVYEETGVKNVNVIRKLPTYQRANSYKPDEYISINMFIFETDQDNLMQIENDVAEVKWCAIDSVENTLTLEEDKKYFRSIKKFVK